jgi:hypothetical protein
MNRADALKLVATELAHIPHWPGEHQGMLRAIYHMLRANVLGQKASGSAGDALLRCFATIRRDFPDAQLDYDRGFFNV